MKLPDPEHWSALAPVERLAYRLSAGVNEHPALKKAATFWLSNTSRYWMENVVGEILHVDGADHLPRDRSILLVANHLTYFDFYAASVALWRMYARKPFLYCPVRSSFFYDHPLGSVLNAGVAGFAMYPPIFREKRSPGLNRHALDRCADLLRWSPRTIVAIHPEGTRNKTGDPYTLGEPKPGAGVIAHRVRATVIPLFINGLTQDFSPLLRTRLLGGPELVRLFFGPAIPLDDLYDAPGTRETHAAIVRRMMSAIAACATRDRLYMASRP